MKYTIPLNKIKRNDYITVGSKAAFLGEFTKNRHINIQRGFVLPAYVFEAVLVANGAYSSFYKRFYKTNFEDRGDIQRFVHFAKWKILNMRIPDFVLVEVVCAVQKLEPKMLAVRSSAVVEDETGLSWAGQFETVLGGSVDTLERDIKKVWASMFSYKALLYRVANKRIYDSYGMAVIVQEIIPAQVSGVGFSVNSNSEYEDVYTVEAVLGMGNMLVSGKETPDSYVIAKKEHLLIDVSISVQKKASIFIGDKLTSKKLSRSQGSRMFLSQKDVIVLSKYMKFLEEQLRVPVDIEWAKHGNQITLLQVRSITYKMPHVEIRTHKLVWHKQVQAFLVTEIWAASEKYYAKKNLGIKATADPMFVYNPNSGTDAYYNKDDIRNKPVQLLEFYKNKPALFNKAFKQYMKLVEKMESDNFLERPLVEIFDTLERAWPFMGVLYILLDLCDRGAELPKWLEKKVVHARIVGEKVSHRVFSYILTERETAIGGPVKGFYYTDFLTKEEIVSGVPVPASKLRQRGRKTFVYYQDEIYIGKQARQLIKEKTLAIKLNNLNNDGKYSGKRIYTGKMSGRVYVSSGHTDMYNMPNEYILVTKTLSPECVPFLPERVAGLIIEEGGEFSHGAILARERKIPCIVGVKNITKILKTGDEVSVNTNSTVIEAKNKKTTE